MKIRSFALGLAAVSVAAVTVEVIADQPGFGPRSMAKFMGGEKSSPEYKAAVVQGRAEADLEVASGHPTVYTYGMTSAFDSLDRETGLVYKAIAGCLVNNSLLGRAEGHNARITELSKVRGPLAGSFKPWITELFGLKAYYTERAKAGSPAPVTLTLDGRPVTAPDGKTTIRAVSQPLTRDDGTPGAMFAVEVRPKGEALNHGPAVVLGTEAKSVEFVWGPKDSGFLVVKSSEGKGDGPARYLALDLRRGAWLRAE